MQLIKDMMSGNYTKPRIFLCEADKVPICQLTTANTKAVLKFNSYSEVSFEVDRIYNDIITGESHVNPYYDKIESPRLVNIEGIGYFEIQGPDLSSDKIKEFKSVTAYSLEYTLSQKYLTNFLINTGEIGSVEVTYAEDKYGVADIDTISPVVLYNPDDKPLSLLHLVLEKTYGWEIGYVDKSLQTISRTFDVDRESVYDFLINEVCQKFNCYIVFDTINNKINVYAESMSQKFMGDGSTKKFVLSPAFVELGTVSVGGYKTTQYTYTPSSGEIIFDNAPESNAIIEITDGALEQWDTDVFVTFDNLAREINISYDADSIKTVLTVAGADDLDIREVNMGLPYIVDLSYYCTPDWFGVDLYDAYTQYSKDYNAKQAVYTENSQTINDIYEQILYEQNRMSADNTYIVERQFNITPTTTGVYFVRGGNYPNYYYTEVQLPDDYNANESYYLFKGEGLNLTETGVDYLYHALQAYFQAYFNDKSVNVEKLDECADYFLFIKNDFDNMRNILASISSYVDASVLSKSNVESSSDGEFMFACINRFLNVMWNQLGSNTLEYCYKKSYTLLQTTAMEAGWGDATSHEYGNYFVVYLMVKSIDRALLNRKATIDGLNKEMQILQQANANIGSSLDLNSYFKTNYPDKYEQFMFRLSAFLREDEYSDDNFIQTGQETLEELYQIKQELKECGKIELNRLCQPTLQFSMTMANIYALPEFEPIINQFQLGNVIKVGLRSDYIKQSRLLQVNIGLDDFTDFSCEFGELTSFKKQSDIHADLLSKAISAGKQVASSASYWNKGTDQANSIDLRLQKGLIDATTSIKSMDGSQGVEIDTYGVHLRKFDSVTGEYDPEQGWMTNNKFLYSNDSFKTVNSVFGKYKIDDNEYWGLLANAVVAGYIEGSKMRGGTIQIGDLGNNQWSFEVDENGNVSMLGGLVKFGATTNSLQDVTNDIQNQINNISEQNMYRVEVTTVGPTIITTNADKATMTCRVYSWDTDITNDLDDSLFIWKRTSNNSEQDEIWNAMPEHQGVKSITIGANDVIENSNFTCEVNLPE